MSSYLFILVVDLLGRMVSKAVSVGLLEAFSIRRRGGPLVPFIQFANDSLVLLKAELDGMRNLRCMLLTMEAATGLKVNRAKSTVSHVGNENSLGKVVAVLGCETMPPPITYLGLPLGAKCSSKSIWGPVIERVEKRLASWKGRFLPKGGKLVLLKSVLSSLPTYFLSVFRAPCSIINQLERLQRNFLWGSTGCTRKIHWVWSNEVCRPVDSEGLGLKDLKGTNRAVLNKWIWKFGSNRNAPWRRVVVAKYGEEQFGWFIDKPSGPVGCSVWKDIYKEMEPFVRLNSFSVHNGETVRF